MMPSQVPRTDSAGRPCPPWCVARHSELRRAHFGTAAGIDAPSILARPVRAGSNDGQPRVVVSGSSYPAGLELFVAARHAEDLAGLIEMLAAATPGQHGQLAAAIRRAAVTVTEAAER